MTCVDVISAVSDVLVGLSAIIVAVLGIVGITQWRAEMKGKVKFELARKMVTLVYRFRDQYKWARNPAMYYGEAQGRKKSEFEGKFEMATLDELYARRNRLDGLRAISLELNTINWEAETLLDKDVVKCAEDVINLYNDLLSVVERYFGLKLSDVNSEEANKLESKVYARENDELSSKIDDAVQALVKALQKYIK